MDKRNEEIFGDKLHEECGVFGVYNKEDLDTAHLIYYGLYSLQHRGQESCGIAINNDNHIVCYKDLGLVSDVFNDFILSSMQGNMAIGHVRYSTTGSNTRENAQPLATKYIKGTLTIAHNGNISNAAELRSELELSGAIFQSTNDSEVIAFLIARERLVSKSIEEAVSRILPKLQGSYSMLIMSPRKLIAVRDPYGFRPLCMGKIGENSIVFSSESCALDSVRAEFIRDVKPGEIIVVGPDDITYMEEHVKSKKEDTALCIFEQIYFARPDSIIDGQSVYDARIAMGHALAKENPVDADMVIGVPDSGIIAAIGYAQESGIAYGEGLVKNRYIGRTFIQPTQSMREASVNIKLNALGHNVKGKRIVMIDDSIVRGTTIANIVALLKQAGATEVHVRISSPKFLWECYFGTDISDREQLACNKFTEEELREKIGADSLSFLNLKSLENVVKDCNIGFCDGCFSGVYPFPVHGQSKLAFES